MRGSPGWSLRKSSERCWREASLASKASIHDRSHSSQAPTFAARTVLSFMISDASAKTRPRRPARRLARRDRQRTHRRPWPRSKLPAALLVFPATAARTWLISPDLRTTPNRLIDLRMMPLHGALLGAPKLLQLCFGIRHEPVSTRPVRTKTQWVTTQICNRLFSPNHVLYDESLIESDLDVGQELFESQVCCNTRHLIPHHAGTPCDPASSPQLLEVADELLLRDSALDCRSRDGQQRARPHPFADGLILKQLLQQRDVTESNRCKDLRKALCHNVPNELVQVVLAQPAHLNDRTIGASFTALRQDIHCKQVKCVVVRQLCALSGRPLDGCNQRSNNLGSMIGSRAQCLPRNVACRAFKLSQNLVKTCRHKKRQLTAWCGGVDNGVLTDAIPC